MTQPADFERLYDNVQMHCTGVLLPAMQAELFEVMRDFCQKTNVYNQVQTIAVSASANTYALIPPSGSAIKRLLGITSTGTLPPRPFTWPVGLTLPATLQLYQALNNSYSWDVQYSLYPVDPVDGNGNPIVPAWILDNYFDAFFSGLRYRLHMQRAKPYSDPAMAAAQYKLYLQGRGQAFSDVERQNVYNGQAWTYPGGYVTYGRQRGV